MDQTTARLLMRLTSEFYQKCTGSFSATRQGAWQGWHRVLAEVAPLSAPWSQPLRVLDVGCGNLRFERFLASEGRDFEALCLDNCEPLAETGLCLKNSESSAARLDTCRFVRTDIIDALLADTSFSAATLVLNDALTSKTSTYHPDSEAAAFDLAVAFGFFHHIPTSTARERLLRALVQSVHAGGFVAVSLWRFGADARLLRKAQKTTQAARERFGALSLDDGDFLLPWAHDEDVFRYCHHFYEADIDRLTQAVSADAALRASFLADGKSDMLNRYLVFQRRT